MSATDELRRMLDECGVFWIDVPLVNMKRTCWKISEEQDGYCYFDEDAFGVTELTVTGITPAQAIAATLGRGTCHKVLDFDGTAWICSECGEHIGPRRWNYCPNCGRKVMCE